MLEFILLLTILLPLAWLVSEFQSWTWIRILLGCSAIAMSFGVAWIAGSLRVLDYNTSYGTASQRLIEKTIQELNAGNESKVIENLRWINSRYEPNYETGRVDYERLVGAYVERFDDVGRPEK